MSIDDKKRKHTHDKAEKKAKKSKKDKTEKDHKKHKSTAIIVESTGRRSSSAQTLSTPSSSFSEVSIKLYIHLAPIWAGKTMDGVNEILNAFLMKHVSEVDGIVLAHSDIELLSDKGKVLYDSPFCHFFIKAKLLVWKPKKGSKLVGRINLQSQDHIGLLIYGTFNASIPKSRIPSDRFEWRSTEQDEKDKTKDDEEADEEQEENNDWDHSQQGEWVYKDSGASLGGDDGSLEFNVMDVIEANNILTVTGSL